MIHMIINCTDCWSFFGGDWWWLAERCIPIALMCLHCIVLHWCVYIALCCKASSSTPPCASPFAKNKRKQGKLGATCRTKYHTVGNNNHPPWLKIVELNMTCCQCEVWWFKSIWPLAQCDWLEFFSRPGFEAWANPMRDEPHQSPPLFQLELTQRLFRKRLQRCR